ncbi:MAG: sugar transferase [Bacteroidetes bacterium]|nr:sugar transferase [Bacteroidota bacterium]
MKKIGYKNTGKRLLDIVLGTLLLLLCLPILLTSAFLLLFFQRGRVFFLQERTGRQQASFTVYKLATMRPPAPQPSGLPMPDADRITPLGRILRSLAIDELPQLVNVLQGHMSLVGPRPLLPDYLPHYTPRQQQRHLVKPGLTGLAQVNGRNHSTWEERLEWDVRYVERFSLLLDIKILLLTPRALLCSRQNPVMPRLDEKS